MIAQGSISVLQCNILNINAVVGSVMVKNFQLVDLPTTIPYYAAYQYILFGSVSDSKITAFY